MLFHLTTEDDIRAIHEQEPTETDAGGSTFGSEQQFTKLAREWPMKRLVEIWNRLPGVQAVAWFTGRKTAIARIWRAIQPQTERPRRELSVVCVKNRMFRKILVTLSVISRLLAQQNGAVKNINAMFALPSITHVNIPGSSMELIAGSSERFHQLFAGFAGAEAVSILDPLLPYCVIVKNNSPSTIASVTVRWELTDSSGSVVSNTGQFDIVGSGVRPGEMVLMAPISGLSLDMAGEPPKLRNVDRLSLRIVKIVQRYLQKPKIVISLDSVIFQDATIIGPDVAGKLDEINRERSMSRQLATELLKRGPAERLGYLAAVKAAVPKWGPVLASEPHAQQMRLAEMYEGVIAATSTDEQLFRRSLENTNAINQEIHRRSQ